jgi:hypothetical protein
VYDVIEGVLQPEHAVFAECFYTTLKTSLGLVVFATERFSLAPCLQLFVGSTEPSTDGAVMHYLASAETLSCQLKIYRRLLSRYRNNLEVTSR